MTKKHEPADDNLLQIIAEREKELEAKVAQAKEAAHDIVEEAQRRADTVREQARREAAELEQRVRAEIATETEAVVAQRLAAAQAEAQRVRTRASERMREAVGLVVKRVLDGLSDSRQ